MPVVLTGVHFLLTYKCDQECDHCFIWGSAKAKDAFSIGHIKEILREAKALGTVNYVSIEGGEPFLFYPIMIEAAKEAVSLGFRVEIISNCYWATCPEDCRKWLLPLAEIGNVRLSLSSDLYHSEKWASQEVKNAVTSGNALGINVGIIAIKNPEAKIPCPTEIEQIKVDCSELMYKGRAVSKLVQNADKKPWRDFTKCPYENLASPERVHVDPLGFIHVCQGISIGNAWQRPFSRMIEEYNPNSNPILEPLIRGGPVALVDDYRLPHDESYADACHLCYASRLLMRNKYPDTLAPDQMYGKLE